LLRSAANSVVILAIMLLDSITLLLMQALENVGKHFEELANIFSKITYLKKINYSRKKIMQLKIEKIL